jgi:hypothetical protein
VQVTVAVPSLNLFSLRDGMPGITAEFGAGLAQAAAVCLEDRGHQNGVKITVMGDNPATFSLHWETTTDQMRRCWNDHEVCTEHGAYCLSFLLLKALGRFTVLERSRKGTGFDYWLGEEGDLPFQKKARLEISGIRNGDERAIRSRVKQKLAQTSPSDGTTPAIISVVEFSTPLTHLVKK